MEETACPFITFLMFVTSFYYNPPCQKGPYPSGALPYGFQQTAVNSSCAQPSAQQAPQDQSSLLYSGYSAYISPYQHPVVVQQVSTAANNWFLESAGKFPWTQVVPTWSEAARMWIRGAHERWVYRNPQPKDSAYRVGGELVRNFSRLA